MDNEVIELLEAINSHLASINEQLYDIKTEVSKHDADISNIISELESVNFNTGAILNEI